MFQGLCKHKSIFDRLRIRQERGQTT